MVEAVAHLVSLGHERIGFLGGSENYEHVQRRLSRWREAVQAEGLTPGPVVHAGGDSSTAAAAMLDGTPTAVVCASDTLALAIIAEARARGLGVPEDVSVTGFDDSVLAALSSPTLTSVRVDYAEFGAAAAAALLARIDGEELPTYSPSRPTLEVRASTGEPGRAVSTRS
jgi:LacI family transcriptional regulator, repressor for deo operon, udp, cdd, tsx, nupC, and nupG